jgi:HK97 family phage major capsid protein
MESFSDGGLNITAQVQEGLRAKFSAVVDRDLLVGSGQGQVPAGLVPAAAPVAADSLWAAVIKAKAEISAAGGTPTHLAASPDIIAAEESRVDADDRPIWLDGLATYAGLQVVPTPAADPPLLYDRDRVHLVVRSDYEALLSEHVTPAFERYGMALRLTARLAAACPAPVMAMRRLEVSDETRGGQARGKPKPAA